MQDDVGVAKDTPIIGLSTTSCDYHVSYELMALTKEDDFPILPPVPLGVPSSGADQQSANGSGAHLFHEIGGTVFEIPPLPDDFDEFSLSPDAVKTSSNKGIFSLPMGGVTDPLAGSPLPPPLADSSLPPLLADSPLPPPLPDLSMDDPEFAPFTGAPLSSISTSLSPQPNGATSSTTPSQSSNGAKTSDCDPAASSEGWGDDGFADFTGFQSNSVKEPAATTSASSSSVTSTSASSITTPTVSVTDPSNAVATASDSDIGFADFTSWSTASESHKPTPAPPPSSSQDPVSVFGSIDAFSDPVSNTTAGTKEEINKLPADEEGFGAFSDFSGPVLNTATSKLETKEPAVSSTAALGEGFGAFSDFSDLVLNTAPEEITKPTAALNASEGEEFGASSGGGSDPTNEGFADFNAFSDPVSNTKPGDEEFGQFTTSSNDAEEDEGFGAFSGGGDFAAFSTAAPVASKSNGGSREDTSTAAVPPTGADEGFGAFSDFSDPVSSTAPSKSNGGTKNITAPSAEEDEFTAFSSGVGDFGAFSDASVTVKDDKGFGDFQGDDDFGEFGSFSAPPPLVSSTGTNTASPPTARSMGMSTSSQRPDSQAPKDVMFMCFPSVSMDTVVGAASSSVVHITQYLQSSSNWVWSSLSTESASTNSLYQWKQSLLQDHFYTSLNVDPMLAPAVKTAAAQTPVYSQQLSDGLLSPGTGLLEGFGFESISKPEPQTKMESGDTFGWDSSQGATLLDLSLPPSSPTHPSEQGISLDADLVGLDFTSAPSQTEALPTTSDFSSTWMDAELLELGVEATNTAEPESNRTQPTAGPVASVEEHLVQLGLDTSKTTWRHKTPDTNQLSQEARTLLEKLPDLSFMICEAPSEIL